MKKFLILFILLLHLSLLSFSQTTYYVDAAKPDNNGAGTGWGTAKRDLQVAINIANAGDQIWVKAGSYLPTQDPFGNSSPANNRDKSFTLKEGVKVYGGFAGNETQLSQRNWKLNVTTLSGDLGVVNTLSDNAYHVVLSVNLTVASVFDGFTITKGYATAPWLSAITVGTRSIERYKGAGIYNSNSSTQYANLNITQNSADCTDRNDDSWGAGMVSENSASSITDCLFVFNSFLVGGNSAGVFGSGLIITGGSSHTITRCVFANNTSGSGILSGSSGGGLYLSSGAHTITNSIFYGNTADNGAAIGFGGAQFNTSSFVNCTFANNTSRFAGTSFSGFANALFRNCILWNNNPTSTSVAGRNEIFSQDSRSEFWPIFTNCIIRDATGTPLGVPNTVASNILTGNPSFMNYNDGDGPDNIWGTADDGLRLQCNSPATGAGTGTTPLTDILGLPRTSVIDLGAYEGGHENGIGVTTALPTSQATVQLSIAPIGLNSFSNCINLLASLRSGAPYTVAGTVTTKVWIESTQPASYVRRHYEMMPANNASTATGKVTLYFTQQEFNDFNGVSVVDLPAGPSDASGKANLLIEKRSGVSNDGTGYPATYSGTITTIDPLDADIIWNSPTQRWEVSFDVEGFGGFFVKTSSAILPLHLTSFSVSGQNNCNLLSWKTENENNVRSIQIEKADEGDRFYAIGTMNAKNEPVNFYSYNDCAVSPGTVRYRLKILDNDGTFIYSTIISIRNASGRITVFPNPVNQYTNLFINDSDLYNTNARLVNGEGKSVLQIRISGPVTKLNLQQLYPGIYYLQLSNGQSIKIVKR